MSQNRLPIIQPNAEVAAPPGPDLPELNQSWLDWDGVDCVLADLDDFADLVEMNGRQAGQRQTNRFTDIVDARDHLVDGRIDGLQLTYRFADALWIDTLLRGDGGAFLLRSPAPEAVE